MGNSVSSGLSKESVKEVFEEKLPRSERYLGLENFGNTCYVNATLQALRFCEVFRHKVIAYEAYEAAEADEGTAGSRGKEETILSCLSELFRTIEESRRRTGSVAPRKFVQKVKDENELFRGYQHQDAHEFLSYLLNNMAETLRGEAAAREKKERAGGEGEGEGEGEGKGEAAGTTGKGDATADIASRRTFVDDIFRGTLNTETKCLWCENVTTRKEPFYDLSLEIEDNESLAACLGQFSSDETMKDDEKYFCDRCGKKQEAVKRMRIAETPEVLCCHFKRFKYVESLGQMRKLMNRVVYPFDLQLDSSNTTDCCEDEGRYTLVAAVVHMGLHMHHGHYIALIKSSDQWLCFDDDQVTPISEAQVRNTYGGDGEGKGGKPSTEHSYILFYERARRTHGDGDGDGDWDDNEDEDEGGATATDVVTEDV